MVMTHGHNLLDDPALLERLVVEGGLTRLSFHVDTTQRGRPDTPVPRNERDLHPVREALADLVRGVRRRTGRPLKAAHTVTVTPDNLADVPDVVRWILDNGDVFNTLSLQPVAPVGRTRSAVARDVSRQALAAQIDAGLGHALTGSSWHMGHPDCSTIANLAVVRLGARRVVTEPVRGGVALDRRLVSGLLTGPLVGWTPRGDDDHGLALARLAGRVVRSPLAWLGLPAFVAWRLAGATPLLLSAAAAKLAGRDVGVRPLLLVVHHFMGAQELDTDLGRERLAACAFHVPVGGRMISMCELNATSARAELLADTTP
jgi:hypothetical protein